LVAGFEMLVVWGMSSELLCCLLGLCPKQMGFLVHQMATAETLSSVRSLQPALAPAVAGPMKPDTGRGGESGLTGSK
jgi:hypothetical protein